MSVIACLRQLTGVLFVRDFNLKPVAQEIAVLRGQNGQTARS